MYKPSMSLSLSPSASPSPEPEEEKWYETNFVKKTLKRLGIISWFISHFVLFIGGFVAFFECSLVGLLIGLVCWIILGLSIWTMIDYGENDGFDDVI